MNSRSRTSSMMLIVIMFALADIYAEREIIFPEISALALGFWIMEKPPWHGSLPAVWASPPLAALTGVLLLRYVSLPPFVLIACAFVLVVLQLKLLRSEVFPSISAAMLAIITNTTSWLYPLSVSILMAVIVLGKLYLEHFTASSPSLEGVDLPVHGRDFKTELVYWGKIFSGVLVIAAIALGTGNLFMIAPPLIVAFIELSRPDQPLRHAPAKTVLLLFLASGTGVLWFSLIVTTLHGPLWLFGGLTMGTVFFLYHALGASFPPVAAIALLPALVPTGSFWLYPLHILTGSALFVFMGINFFELEGNTYQGRG